MRWIKQHCWPVAGRESLTHNLLDVYKSMTYIPIVESRPGNVGVTVKELVDFERRADRVWSEDERLAFVSYIAVHPLAGDLIPGAGGLRKVRWAAQGRGKRGGVRVIYYFYNETAPIYLLDLYAKGEQVDLSAASKRVLAALARQIKDSLRARQN